MFFSFFFPELFLSGCSLSSGSLTFLDVWEASGMGSLTTIISDVPDSSEVASDSLSMALVPGPGSPTSIG